MIILITLEHLLIFIQLLILWMLWDTHRPTQSNELYGNFGHIVGLSHLIVASASKRNQMLFFFWRGGASWYWHQNLEAQRFCVSEVVQSTWIFIFNRAWRDIEDKWVLLFCWGDHTVTAKTEYRHIILKFNKQCKKIGCIKNETINCIGLPLQLVILPWNWGLLHTSMHVQTKIK
jgi:hypothetical protein